MTADFDPDLLLHPDVIPRHHDLMWQVIAEMFARPNATMRVDQANIRRTISPQQLSPRRARFPVEGGVEASDPPNATQSVAAIVARVMAHFPRWYLEHGDPSAALVSLYRDGRDFLAPHTDGYLTTGPTPTEGLIMIASLGASRELIFQPIHGYPGPPLGEPKRAVRLDGGSVLVMRGTFQHRWVHEVPATSGRHPRVSVSMIWEPLDDKLQAEQAPTMLCEAAGFHAALPRPWFIGTDREVLQQLGFAGTADHCVLVGDNLCTVEELFRRVFDCSPERLLLNDIGVTPDARSAMLRVIDSGGALALALDALSVDPTLDAAALTTAMVGAILELPGCAPA